MTDPRLDNPAPSGNQRLFDASLRHAVGIQRFSGGEVRRIIELLERADRRLVRQLRERLGSLRQPPVDFTSARLRALLNDVRVARREAMAQLRNQLTPTLRRLAVMEADFETRSITASMPFNIELASVSVQRLRAIVSTELFDGNTLAQWYSSLANADQARLIRTIQNGLSEGSTVQQIVQQVAGTRANRFRDGVLAITRRNAETVVRTAVNGVSNAARESLWQENADIITALRWTSTLDGRTTAVCFARDGKFAPVTPGGSLPDEVPRLNPPGARPPAHPACRSVMVAVIDGFNAIGTRPAITDIRTRRRREINFRAEARRRKVPISQVRREWADANIGSVPSEASYQEWLRTQPAAFQDSVLGKTKGRLFRRGELPLDQFVDESGREFTLEELARTKPEQFEAAGLSPDDF